MEDTLFTTVEAAALIGTTRARLSSWLGNHDDLKPTRKAGDGDQIPMLWSKAHIDAVIAKRQVITGGRPKKKLDTC